MPYHPQVIYGMARRSSLGMGLTSSYEYRVILPEFECVIAQLGKAEPVFRTELVKIYLGLGMVVGRIARPLAGKANDLAKYKV